MAIAWKDVIQKEEYKSLPPDQKVKAQEQYFNEVVAPKAGENAELARAEFFKAYPAGIESESRKMWQKEPSFGRQVMHDLSQVGKGVAQAGVNIANIPAEIADAFVSAGAWGAEKLGIGDGTYTPTYRFELPEGMRPTDDVAKMGSEIIPYLIPIIGPEKAAAAVSSAAKTGRMDKLATWVADLAQESIPGALAQTSGKDQGGLAGAVGESMSGGAFGRAVAKGIGIGADRITASAGDKLKQALGIGTQAAEDTAGAVSKAADPSIFRSKAPEELASRVQPSDEMLGAAERIGMERDLLPSHYSTSSTYQQIEQGLKSMPGSKLAAQEENAILNLSRKADELINEFGGTTDKSALSTDFKDKSLIAISQLDDRAESLYSQVNSAIPKWKRVDTDSIVDHLDAKADTMGGVEYLSPIERRVIKMMAPESNPTYARLDMIRKQVGAAIGKGTGPFRKQTTEELKQLYAALSRDQERAAMVADVGDVYRLATSETAKRKRLEENLVSLIGSDLAGAITSKTGPALKGLQTGDYKLFDQVINKVPEDMRESVVLSALNDVFTQGSRKEKQMSIAGFADWWAGLQRNSQSMKRLKDNIPADAFSRLQDIATVATGIRNAKSKEITTGRVQALLDNFNSDSGFLSKLYDVGKKAAAAEGLTSAIGIPGAGAASAVVSTLMAPKTKRTVLADELLSSPEFRGIVRKVVAGGVESYSARKAAENAIMKSRKFKEWEKTLSRKEARDIQRLGFIAWLTEGPKPETEWGD
ncbi:MAG: hypothetical protein ACRC8W_00985 [Plesiomonas shigelloides]